MKKVKIFYAIILSILFFSAIFILVIVLSNNNPKLITVKNISKSKDKSTYYGKTVIDYNCPNSLGVNTWKIFYIDEVNIYLIADDYISFDNCPLPIVSEIIKEQHLEKSMKDVISAYSGIEDISNEKVKKLNSSYLNEYNYTNDDSMKAVAYILDTSIWSIFAGEKAEYAIGAPTIEMLMKSYSQKYGVDYQAKSDEIGYRISNDGGLKWYPSIINMLNGNDDLYVKKSANNTSGMWVASPSCYSNHYIMKVSNDGSVHFDDFSNNMPKFRPIVCLKSDVYLEGQEDGTYCIK